MGCETNGRHQRTAPTYLRSFVRVLARFTRRAYTSDREIEGIACRTVHWLEHDRVPNEVVVVVDSEALNPVRRAVVSVAHLNTINEQELAVHVRILPEQPAGD